MKKLFAPAAVIAVLFGIAVVYSLRTAGQQPAPQLQRSQVNVTRVKPDMIDAWVSRKSHTPTLFPSNLM